MTPLDSRLTGFACGGNLKASARAKETTRRVILIYAKPEPVDASPLGSSGMTYSATRDMSISANSSLLGLTILPRPRAY